MIALSSAPDMLAAMRTAHDITFSSYVLWPGAVERTLEDAAGHGVHVVVRVNGYFPNGGPELLSDNERAVERLRKLGADAQIVHKDAQDGAAVHLKAAVCDGVAYLDDRNWSGNDIVLRDDGRADVDAVRNAASCASASEMRDTLPLTKHAALESELIVLHASRGDRVDVETETISNGAAAYSQLKHLAENGVRCRLLVSSRKLDAKARHAAELLSNAGVKVRVVSSADKLAIKNGTRAWVGSANATSPFYNGDQTDWGLRTQNPKIVRALQSRFNENWRCGRPLAEFYHATAFP
jgi:phosphatidylserine/phosphatidylglycerophosphate/cardiolipin synthase-like enzyme